ncbi:hypothetical protein ACNKHU_17070 [Shigella flexneri]
MLQARAEPDLIIQAFNEYQLLCALREGPFGVAGLNERIEQFMQQKRKIHRHPHSRWYEGRPVMIARNDSALGLFNGDIGIALDRGQGRASGLRCRTAILSLCNRVACQSTKLRGR